MIISIHVVQVKHILQLKAKFPQNFLHTNLSYELTQKYFIACFSGMGGGNGEGMGGLLTDEEISKHQVNNIILSSSCMLTN